VKRALSLRARLAGLTMLVVALVWLVTAFVTWREARHELAELLAHPPDTSAAHLAKEREEVTREIAEHLLTPLLVALPALGVLLVIAIGLALAPLRRLARDVAQRAPERLDPLPTDALPAEIAPLVGRLNTLFADISRALDNERRFTADAAHELRTPLAALKAQAQVALASVDATERQRALGQILVGCDRATHLVAQLLTLARLDGGTPQPMQDLRLRPIAEQVLAMAAGGAIEKNCELLLDEGDASVHGDPLLLEVLLRNLVDNALLHSGGTRIEVAIRQQDGHVQMTVSDNGRGIAAEDRDRVQQRFCRGASADFSVAPGSGLGLSIVRRIAQLHDGQVRIEAPLSGPGVVISVEFHTGLDTRLRPDSLAW
jgi:signal transduction histidine kinase